MKILLGLLQVNFVFLYTAASRSNKNCIYNFDVWQPDKNVLQKIKELEFRYSNLNVSFARDLLKLKVDTMAELLHCQNLSLEMERLVLNMQSKLSKIQPGGHKNVVAKDTGGENVWKSISSLKSELKKMASVVNKVGIDQTLDDLRTMVADLRAEWIIMKREVQEIHTANKNMQDAQNSMEMNISQLMESVRALQLEKSVMHNKHDSIFVLMKEYFQNYTTYSNESEGHAGSKLITVEKEIQNLYEMFNQLNTKLDILVKLGVDHQNNNTANGDKKGMPQFGQLNLLQDDKVYKNVIPKDCHDVYLLGYGVSGVYRVQPKGVSHSENTYCEMLNNTGWTILQRRIDGSINFTRGWLEYRYGFGNPYGEFWQGNDFLYWLTTQKQYVLRIDLWDWAGNSRFAEYSSFTIGSVQEMYKLHVDNYQGNAGDSLSYHNSMAFSTEDMDNDLHRQHCAAETKSGWWFHGCFSSNLNGVYHTGWYTTRGSTFPNGIVWFTIKESEYYSLKKVEMKVRPKYL